MPAPSINKKMAMAENGGTVQTQIVKCRMKSKEKIYIRIIFHTTFEFV